MQCIIVSILTLKYQNNLSLAFLYVAALLAYSGALYYGATSRPYLDSADRSSAAV